MTLSINMNYNDPSIAQAQNALNAKYPGTTINLINLFNQASQLWSTMITGAKDSSGNPINWTTTINVKFTDQGADGLGAGKPLFFADVPNLPITGELIMNSNLSALTDPTTGLIKSATDPSTFLDTVIHELAHAMGYGTIWEQLSLVGSNADTATSAVQGTYEYTGTNTLAAYQNLLNDKTLSFVPLETTSGTGTAAVHWSTAVFNGELMLKSPKPDYAEPTPISTVTLASFADLGYVVDYSKVAAYAGIYVAPSQQVTSKTPGTPTITSLGFSTLLPSQTGKQTPTTRNPTITDDNAADPNFYKIVTYGTQPNGNPSGGTNTANGNDLIVTKGDADQIYGFAGNDTIQSGAGNDSISGGAGNDVMDGGAGTDTALYADSWTKYDVTGNATSAQVVARAGAATDGGYTDTLSNIEQLTFYAGDKTKAITVSIADAINVAPVAVADTFTIHASSVKGNVLSNDTDANSLIVGLGETKTVTEVSIGGSSTPIAATGFTQVTGQNGTTLNIAANGEYTYSLNGSAVPAMPGIILSSFQYTMSDAHGLTSTSTLTFSTGSSTNVAPTLGTITANNVTQADAGKTSYSFDVAYSDSDGFIDQATIDAKDVTVTYNGNTLTVTGATWNATTGIATYTVTPPTGKWADTNSGTYTIGIVASEVFDNQGASVAANPNAKTFTATIIPNHAPTLLAPATVNYIDTAFVDTFVTKTGTLVGNDVDAGTILTYGIAGGTNNGTTVSKTNAYGTLTVTKATGAYSFVANSAAIEPLGANASDSTLTVTVSDGTLTASQAFTVNIGQSGVTETNGNDIFYGTAGADQWAGLQGNDTYYVNNVGDTITELPNQGWDIVYSTISYTLPVNVEAVVLQESAGKATITGNNAYNYLVGNSSDNILVDGNAANQMAGGAGNDTYSVSHSGDVIVENANAGWDVVWSSVNYTLPTDVEALYLYKGAGNINGYGNSSANVMVGNDSNNLLDAQAGNDTLVAGSGNDTLVGGLGQDYYDLSGAAATSNETIRIAAGDSTANFGAYDYATNFRLGTGTVNTTGFDKLDLVNTTIAANAVVNGIDSGPIKSHQISNGMITFDSTDTHTSPLAISDGYLGFIFTYLNNNISGGQTVGFVCSGNTFVYQDGGSVANDTLVELVGVTATSLSTTGLAANSVWIV